MFRNPDPIFLDLFERASRKIQEEEINEPAAALKSLAKEAGKSYSEAERYYEEAKHQRMKSEGKKEDELNDKDYSYIMGVVKKRLGLKTKPVESKKEEPIRHRYVYGTRDKKWHLVGPDDRDYEYGIEPLDFEEMGPEKAKIKYLQAKAISGAARSGLFGRTLEKKIRETGEMSKSDIEPGGEYYEWAKSIEDDVRDIEKATNGKLKFIRMEPFDKYQGPYAVVKINGNPDTIWDAQLTAGEYYLFVDNKKWIGTAQDIINALNGDKVAEEKMKWIYDNAVEVQNGTKEIPSDDEFKQMKFDFARESKKIKEGRNPDEVSELEQVQIGLGNAGKYETLDTERVLEDGDVVWRLTIPALPEDEVYYFDDKEEAIKFADEEGIDYRVEESKLPKSDEPIEKQQKDLLEDGKESAGELETNSQLSKLLDINDPDLDNAFVYRHGDTVVVNIEPYDKDLTSEDFRRISDKVYDLKPKILDKFSGAHNVEINVYESAEEAALKARESLKNVELLDEADLIATVSDEDTAKKLAQEKKGWYRKDNDSGKFKVYVGERKEDNEEDAVQLYAKKNNMETVFPKGHWFYDRIFYDKHAGKYYDRYNDLYLDDAGLRKFGLMGKKVEENQIENLSKDEVIKYVKDKDGKYLVQGSLNNIAFDKYFNSLESAKAFVDKEKPGKWTIFKLGPNASKVHIELSPDKYTLIDTNEPYWQKQLRSVNNEAIEVSENNSKYISTSEIYQHKNGLWGGIIRDELGQVESATVKRTKEEVKDWLKEHGIDESSEDLQSYEIQEILKYKDRDPEDIVQIMKDKYKRDYDLETIKKVLADNE